MNLKIRGNSAIITASSSGLGKASAAALVREGVNVVINGRDQQKLDQTLAELKALNGGEVIACQGDITKKEDIEKLVKTAVDNFGRIDHLVTSAGGPPAKSFVETTEADWYNSYDLLVMSVVRLVKESLEYLKADGGGTIINITSISVKEAINNLVLSNSVRMTVIGLMKTLAKELAPEIRVNAVLPGSHETSRIKELINSEVENGLYDNYQEGLSAKSKSVPLNKIGDPENLGDLIAFLSSPKSAHINGDSIVVDGGASSSNL
ncbi:MAG: 3-oxoacyl-[acyl-carrier protein] reductase [Halanaerobium sp. 4-GBenrich]|jgi:3-oxoacyl-[acyl-carrier protein] reductase|uniref:3-oxoacyl-[acyl-carrier protein] reductase n=1 Tax=Halanaerobium congolense TaxID=54121 RepID=A0A1G6MER6_9FIRM|nr:SDR family oxidoreductase [Halanaerobium congolense]KXS49591.1 MAG: 3-oxoacyl-[acyl-carrier protein] reductase [Halanaerobium sp. T82-1]ODS50347.1 MAG: 3-oxoacyl-[acyl-carrier protein] reductase [Halanaerobium sp. 4-GBenrich]OEG63272.1 MAG: oxidoreductase [Halanaerobium sp. MDAL1]PUU93584.1 MAG: 3-oxoacyl-acyl-carrier protein reductase [Halanaerobium sp.]PXV66979.1 3-oxoacyl-[acyl-carrier protein] reductase [Halanaerobium congolense]